MRVGIATNWQARGLSKDASIIEAACPQHKYKHFQFTERSDERVDVTLHLETIGRKVLANANRNIWIPNLEFASDEDISIANGSCITEVWCKTHSAYELLQQLVHSKTTLLGFASIDAYKRSIQRNEVFIHIAGRSQHRNTQAVLDAWREHKIRYPLIVVSKYFKEDIPNVTFLDDVDEDVLIHLMNQCKYCLLPTEAGGWEHALHEMALCGAQIITTDADPMNTCGQFLLPVVAKRKQGQTELYKVSPEDVRDMVLWAVNHPMPSLRKQILRGNKEFRERMECLVAST